MTLKAEWFWDGKRTGTRICSVKTCKATAVYSVKMEATAIPLCSTCHLTAHAPFNTRFSKLLDNHNL